jgi:putative ABC transport system permease protein
MAPRDHAPGAGRDGGSSREPGAGREGGWGREPLRAAVRVGRADLLARPGQTALTAVAIFAAATALVVTLALRAGLDDPFAAAKRSTRGADVAVFAHGADLDALARLSGVAAAQSRPFADGFATLQGRSVAVGLEGLPSADAPVDRLHLTAGRRPARPGEVVVERSFAKATGLRVGAPLTLKSHGRTLAATVAGIAVSTEQASYPHWTPGLAWGDERDVRALAAGEPARRLGVRLQDPEAVRRFEAAAQRALPGQRLGFTDWHDVRATITDQARTNTIIIGVNTLLALLVVGFTLATVISGRVLAQRREIGLLKAVGLAPGGVVALLVGEYLALALATGVLGLLAGALIAPLLLEPMSSLLATPTPSALRPAPLALALVLLLAAVALFTALPALRAGRLNTVDALALGRTASARGGTSRAARLAARLKLPATARLGVKDAFAARARAVLTVGALALMVVTLVAALSMEATYSKVMDDSALRAKPWDVRVDPGALGTPQARALVSSRPGVVRTTTIADFPLQAAGGLEVQARALGDGYASFPYAVPDGRMFARPGEAIAGRGLLDALHVRVGDTITLRSGGTPLTLRIVGRHVEPDSDGKVVIFSRATLPRAIAQRISPGDVIARFAPHTDGRALVNTLRRRGVAAELVDDEVRQERADVRPIVYGSSALLVAVGLVNLLTTLLLATRERARDFGVLKAVGLTPRGVLAVVNAGGAVLGLIGAAIGIPAGIVIFRTLMAAMSPSEGTDIVGTPGALAFVLLIPFVLAVTALASSLPARRAARTSAATVLRAE